MNPTQRTRLRQDLVDRTSEDMKIALDLLNDRDCWDEEGNAPIPSGITTEWCKEISTKLEYMVKTVQTITDSVESISRNDTGETHE